MYDNNKNENINWDGYEIFQNSSFSKIYAKHESKDIKKIGNNFAYLSRKPLVGYTNLFLPYPRKEGLKTTIKESIEFCTKNKIAKMVLRTPYSNVATALNITNVTGEDGTVVIDLTKDLEELWNNLKKKTRQKIRQGEKRGCRISFGDNNDFEEWWKLYCLAVERIGFPSTEHDFAFEAFQDKSISKLFICKIDSKLACGTLVLLSSRNILAWLGASEPTLLDYRPNFMLQWEIIKWGKANGFKVFDMGGIKLKDPDHGPTFFKSGWGGEIKKYYVYELDIPSVKAQMIRIGKKIVPGKIKSAVKRKLK